MRPGFIVVHDHASGAQRFVAVHHVVSFAVANPPAPGDGTAIDCVGGFRYRVREAFATIDAQMERAFDPR